MELLIGALVIAAFFCGWRASRWWSRRDLTFTPSEWDELLSGLEDGTYKIKLERRQKGE